MVAWRTARALAAAASVTALTLAGSSATASADTASPVVFRVPLTGAAEMAGLPPLTFTGQVQVAYPPDPVVPPNPIQPVSTVLRDVVGTGGGVSCDARGAETFKVDRSVSTLTFTGSYRLFPPDPIIPQDAACRGHEIGVKYVVNLDSAGQVIGVPAATVDCIEFSCTIDNP
ncbi:hypothetical protein [Streptomyces sp. NPDC057580]|uniref:hypothetical protein n=1 Tax=Streptomyces sp. NPDC057580 TaxID=3346173 RepID=UPI003674B842